MKKPNHSGSGQIRIIGGQWRGRKLPVPDSPGLRPTTDRVRETLFNWLAPVIASPGAARWGWKRYRATLRGPR